MQPLDLALRLGFGLLPDLRVERSGRVLLQLLLPGVDLVRMHLIPLRQIGYSRRSRIASSAIFAFSAASILRLVFFIVRSVYHDRTAPASN